MQNVRISRIKMMKMFTDHGMSTTDFWDFYEQFGINAYYSLTDIRSFLGY